MEQIAIKGWRKGEEITLHASKLFLGSADFLRPDNMDAVAEMFETYIAHGGNIIDTAEHYRHAELAIGEWFKVSGNRKRLQVLTKGCHPKREARDVKRVNAECIREDVLQSLEKLNTDYVELYALHRDDPTVPVGEILEALAEQIEKGYIQAIGVSNWELPRIIEAQEYAQKHGLYPLSFTSPNLSLAVPMIPRWPGCVSADKDMVDWHLQHDLALVSWSSQAGGFFSGRFTPEHCPDPEIKACFYNEDNWLRYERAKDLAVKKGCSPIQIALAWVLHKGDNIAAIIGPEKVSELESSLEAANIQLSSAEVKFLALEE